MPTLARTEFAPHLVKYGETAAVSPELTIASRVGTAEGDAGQLGHLFLNLITNGLDSLEAVLPSYLWRFSPNGQFDRQTA